MSGRRLIGCAKIAPERFWIAAPLLAPSGSTPLFAEHVEAYSASGVLYGAQVIILLPKQYDA